MVVIFWDVVVVFVGGGAGLEVVSTEVGFGAELDFDVDVGFGADVGCGADVDIRVEVDEGASGDTVPITQYFTPSERLGQLTVGLSKTKVSTVIPHCVLKESHVSPLLAVEAKLHSTPRASRALAKIYAGNKVKKAREMSNIICCCRVLSMQCAKEGWLANLTCICARKCILYSLLRNPYQ